MDKILVLILIFLTVDVAANDLSSISISKEAGVTKLLPEIKGLDHESGLFGVGVALDGDYMVISAPLSLYKGGFAVYKKESTQWALQQMFDTASLPNIDHLGSSVDISGDTIVIGAMSSSIANDESGAVLVYQLIEGLWQHTETISSPNSRSRGQFGSEVMLKGDTAVIAEQSGFDQPGIFYVYTITDGSWQLSKEISDMDLDWQFGTSELKIDFDESHMVLSRSESGSSGSLLRVYDLADDNWLDYQELESPAQSITYGNALSINGEKLAVGDYGLNSDAGVVYVYQKINNTWQLQESLFGPEADQDKEFGASVKLAGDQLIIGSYGDDEAAGSAGAVFYYEYEDGQWTEQQKLMASDAAVFDRLGFYADFAKNELVVSAIYADAPSNNSGKVYSFLFANDNWNENQVITPLQIPTEKIFSNALALHDDWVIVGADGDDDQGDRAGAVYLYKKESGELVFEEKLYADQAAADQQFGKNIVIKNDVMLIGATGNRVRDGNVHYYQMIAGQWVFQNQFKPADISETDYFGYVLSLNNDWLAVSAISQTNNESSGAVYMFRLINNEWVEQEKLLPTTTNNVSAFGFDIDLSANRLAIGTWVTAKAFIFELNGNDWQQIHEIASPDPNDTLFFGSSVNLYGDQVIINGRFSPFIYTFNGAILSQAELLDENITEYTRYIDIDNNVLVMSRSSLGLPNRSGTLVYQFINDAWRFIYELPDPPFRAFYSNDITILGREVLVGNFNNSERGLGAGAAYWVQEVGDLIFADGFD